jgi:alpha-tubulin suppressor-like RCC1 family protein
VGGLAGVVDVAAGYAHSLALKKDGTVYVWGANDFGQLGIGNTVGSNVPVAVNGLTGVVAIAAGWYHSLALKKDGTVWAWGWNIAGTLGDGTPEADRKTPVQVKGPNGVGYLTGILALSAGYPMLAIKSGGTAWDWGRDINSTPANNLPRQVANLPVVVSRPRIAAYIFDIEQRYPLADAARAHTDLAARKTVGSTVLIP